MSISNQENYNEKSILHLQNIRKIYPNGKEALKGVSLDLTPGIYGLLGPNGAGKSTMIKIITGLLDATEGEVIYGYENIKQMDRRYRKILGYMPQQQKLYETFTGTRFLWYMATLKGMAKEEAKKQIPRLLEVVNLSEAAGRKIGHYSGGMKQRLLLAQALLDDPKILILDEPTAGLDPRERIRIRNFISEIARDKIVLLATHVVPDIECIAKEIILLNEGVIIDQGTPFNLIRKLEGKVWEKVVSPEELENMHKDHLISNMVSVSDGFLVKIIDDNNQEGWKAVHPTLEDVYLYNFERVNYKGKKLA